MTPPTDHCPPAATDIASPPTPDGPTPAPARAAPKPTKFPCPFPDCKARVFSRTADLERHTRMVHLHQPREQYPCDYKHCGRRNMPFFRQDHFRDHLFVFHKEDLMRRGSSPAADMKAWWGSRASRALFGGWWRCSRCLKRASVEESGGYVCPCGHEIERERREVREGKKVW